MSRFKLNDFLTNWYNFNPNMEITFKDDQPPEKVKDPIICHCKICGGTFESNPNNLKLAMKRNSKTKGCRICSGQAVQKGVNDFATLHPELMKYIVNPDDVSNIISSSNSRKKILCKCDICHYQAKKYPYDLIRYGFNCPCCTSGFSAPNRFIRVLMSQLPIEKLFFEYKRQWTQEKIYDCYFEYNSQKYVIEMDGEQHFRDAWYQTKEEHRDNDKLKDQLAKDNNVIMIRINCKNTDYDYLYNNINNSILSQLFNLNTVDWDKCKDALKNDLLIQVCNYFNENKNNEKLTTKEIAEHFNIAPNTVTRYLNKGTQLDLCQYNGREFVNKAVKKAVGKSQIVYNLNGEIVGKYDTITELRRVFPELTRSDTDKISYAQNHGQNKVKIKNYYFERI